MVLLRITGFLQNNICRLESGTLLLYRSSCIYLFPQGLYDIDTIDLYCCRLV